MHTHFHWIMLLYTRRVMLHTLAGSNKAAALAKSHDNVWKADKSYFSQLEMQTKALKEIDRYCAISP